MIPSALGASGTWGTDSASGSSAAAVAHRSPFIATIVVLMLPTGPAFFEAFFGTLLAGAVPVPVAPPHSVRRESAGR